MAKKRILVAPLDWGLGHATRSIPIIKALLEREVEVLVASNGRPLALLRKEFPELESFELPPYDVRYPTGNIHWNVAIHLPQIFKAIIRENRIIAEMVKQKKLDAVISDHRLGCHHARIPSIIIAHQLHLRLHPMILQWPVRQFHYALLKPFDECWIPDWEEPRHSLAGNLDHPPISSPPARYIGPLSRVRKMPESLRYDVFILLSGPEPQRTRLEEVLLNQASQFKGKVLFVQGKPDMEKKIQERGNLEIVPYVTSSELEKALAESQIVVCRSGYSTLMDLAACGKKALLIPTPGQTEQEYLSQYLEEKGFFLSRSQAEIDLIRDIPQASQYSGFPPSAPGEERLSNAIDALLRRIAV